MKPKELRIDACYDANVSGRRSVVRLDRIENQFNPMTRKEETRYHVTDVSTNKQLVWKSSAKFLKEHEWAINKLQFAGIQND